MNLLVNIDVPDLRKAEAFYVAAFGFQVSRRLGPDAVELNGAGVPVYLLEKTDGSLPFEGAQERRSFTRHWTPVHLDFVVDDLEAALARALEAGAREESAIGEHAWGRLVLLSDPFGNGVCLLQLSAIGYAALEAR